MASSILAKMAVQISANTAEFNKAMEKSSRSLANVSKETQKTNTILSTFGKVIGAAGLAVSVGALAKSIFDLGVKQEQTTIAFNTFLGSATKGRQLLKELNEFSIATPFSPDQVNNAAKALLSFGLEANKILPTLKFLGDVSSGTGKDLTELAIIFGQIRSTGRLMGQDLLQLINAGFNPLQQISKDTGKSVGELKKDMEKGLITFDQVEGAFKRATSEGGLFFNLMEKQSKTVGGRLSTLTGNIQELGKNIFGLASGPLPFLISVLDKGLIELNKILTPVDLNPGLVKFEDKLKSIEAQFQSTNKTVQENANVLRNAFAVDVVNAINEANAELDSQRGILDGLASEGIKSGDAFDRATLEVKALTDEVERLQGIKIDLFSLSSKTTSPNISNAPSIGDAGVLGFDPNALATSVEQAFNRINGVILDVNGNIADLSVTVGEFEEEVPDSFERVAEKMVEISGLITGGIVDIADAFGQSLTDKKFEFGKAILSSLASFAQQFGAILIATGIAAINFKRFSGPGMVAAGIALVALGGAVRGVINRRPNLGGGGGSSGGFSGGGGSFGTTGLGTGITLSGDFELQGYSLQLLMDRQTYKNGRIGG